VAAKYEVGQLVRGTVTQLANFGAFARIEDGIEGLIHVSELTDERITHPKQVVKEGDELLLRIIRIDPQRRRMGLSLRRALDTPDTELEAVFGEGVLEERDRIVQNIRASLEAEGIEIGSGRRSDDEDGDSEERGSEAVTSADSAEAVTSEPAPADTEPEGPVAAMVESADAPQADQVPTAAAAPAAEKPKRTRKSAEATLPAEGAEGLSAIELAFAMAGANLDLDDEDESHGAAESDEPASGEEREG
jgi:predicted RNA-binding protein with RPS1 domain